MLSPDLSLLEAGSCESSPDCVLMCGAGFMAGVCVSTFPAFSQCVSVAQLVSMCTCRFGVSVGAGEYRNPVGLHLRPEPMTLTD